MASTKKNRKKSQPWVHDLVTEPDSVQCRQCCGMDSQPRLCVHQTVTVPAPVTTALPRLVGMSLWAARARAGVTPSQGL